ncbi:hypothetical protein EKE94_03185 [Mesobaculum littorinae]|uniref:Uncharacterized protein n=1 Tax=Mesobaculum littorinae TaxID=2486419 RepID=A0A438AM04_9RHOB|nr:hypothetical protein [Mesobaculum littorinae]RVV99699.1 hypothetical protein EKE94_03185 [Mesobaculum littorinae]
MPREILAILDGYGRARRTRHEEARALNHDLAGLVAYAFHQPGDMPEYTPLSTPAASPAPEAPAMSTEAEIEQVRGFFMAMAMQGGEGG